jgi:hypothetical protein
MMFRTNPARMVLFFAGYPRLAGLSRDHLVRQLNAFADGSHASETMLAVAKALTPDERQPIAACYGLTAFGTVEKLILSIRADRSAIPWAISLLFLFAGPGGWLPSAGLLARRRGDGLDLIFFGFLGLTIAFLFAFGHAGLSPQV